jgi:hypothetical protein
MRTRWRKFSILLMVGALAAANCYGAPAALAAHHPKAPALQQTADHHSHAHDSMPHAHDVSVPDDHGAGNQGALSDSSKVCCTSMSCSATAILASTVTSAVPSGVDPVAVLLDDAVQTVAIGTIDPPPRTI